MSTQKLKNNKSRRWRIIIIVVLMVLSAIGWWTWTVGRPWYYGIQAYAYGFPMIVMDATKNVSTAVSAPGEITAPVNQFSVMTRYPDASYRAVVRTGLDALFAVAWADLDKEPLVLSVPDTKGRYYVIALFDMWSNVFASIGKRTTGTDSVNFLIAGPGWKGSKPDNIKQVYYSPTRYVWVNAQMQADGPKDYDEVNALQKQYKLTPLSSWGQPWSPPSEVAVDLSTDTKTPILEQVRNMDAAEFFGRLALLMKNNPPTPEDGPMVEKLKKLGIVPGEDFDFNKLSQGSAKALQRGMGAMKLLEKGVQKLETKDGWIVIPANFANYGTDYLTRAGIALIGLGAILPVDILYPTAFNDSKDKPLDAANQYILHFEKTQLPPAKATWSVSMYDPDGFYVPNAINRYNLAKWMPMKYNNDGSLDIYIQSVSPGADKESNWLPAPPAGLFSLTTRIFWPEEAALNGSWSMPGIKTIEKLN